MFNRFLVGLTRVAATTLCLFVSSHKLHAADFSVGRWDAHQSVFGGAAQGDSLWITAGEELYLASPDSIELILVDKGFGHISNSKYSEGTLWIVSTSLSPLAAGPRSGLFKIKSGAVRPIPVGGDFELLYSIELLGNELWIQASNGLFRVREDEENAEMYESIGGEIREIAAQGDRLWIQLADGQLYSLRSDNEVPEKIVHELGENYSLSVTHDIAIFRPFTVARDPNIREDFKDVFFAKPEMESPVRIDLGSDFTGYSAIGDSMWITNGSTFSRLDLTTLQRTATSISGRLVQFFPDDEVLWIVSDNVLFKALPNEDNLIECADALPIEMGEIESINLSDEIAYIGTPTGFYRLSPNARQPHLVFQARFSTGIVTDNIAWVHGLEGVSRIERQPVNWNSGLKLSDRTTEINLSGSPMIFSWTIDQPDFSIQTEAARFLVKILDENGTPVLSDITKCGVLKYALEKNPLGDGSYKIVVSTEDLWGTPSQTVSQNFTIDDSTAQFIVRNIWPMSKWLGIFYVLFGVCGFFVLVFASRFYDLPLRILTDSYFEKFYFFFGFLIRNIPPIRVWILERYFNRLKVALTAEHQYVISSIVTPSGENIDSNQFQEEFHRVGSLWVCGKPGSGKTELLREFMRKYCRESSLYEAWRRYGFIPILIKVRDFQGVSVDDAIYNSLKKYGVDLGEGKEFKRFIESGGFVLLIDGLNEGTLGPEIKKLIAGPSEMRLIVTSQDRPLTYLIPEYKLSNMTAEFARNLYKSFIEFRRPNAISNVPDAIWALLQSAYEVRLIAELACTSRSVPETRLSLYQAILELAVYLSDGELNLEVISRFAWERWLAGERRFQIPVAIKDALIRPLIDANILTRKEDDWFQFGHDQMRAYLAARWLVIDAKSLGIAAGRLRSSPSVWDFSTGEQDMFFGFVCELSDNNYIQMLATLAAEDLDRRSHLMKVVITTSQLRDLTLSLHSNTAPAI